MRISINNVDIDWVSFVPKNLEAEVTEHTIQGGAKKDLTSHVNVKNRTIPLDCIIKEGDFIRDKELRYDKLYEMAESKEIIQLGSTGFSILKGFFSRGKYEEEYAIINIEEKERGDNFISFSMILKAVNFATLKLVKTSIQPDKSLKTAASKKETKLIGTKELKEMGIERTKY